jgi:hypothetical protein
MKSKNAAGTRLLWKDPHILPHHDGLVHRNQPDCLDGGMISPTRLIADRRGWTAADIAYYLGYPDDVFYDPEGNMPPTTLYAFNRILSTERLMANFNKEKIA